MNTNNIHDSFARETLSYKDNAACFFRGILPEDVREKLDFESLTEEKTSYTDEELSAYFSDVVYECGYKGSPLKLALLFEHKSYIPVFPHRQILRYILNIWDRAAKQNKPIPFVLPIILYHGKQRWATKPLHTYLSGDNSSFARFIPGFEYLLIDLSQVPDKEIINLFANNPAVKLWLLIQKYIYFEATLVRNLDSFFSPDIVYFSLEAGLRFLGSIWRYIFEATNIDPDTILRKIPMLPGRAKEAIMTTAEKLRKQGRQEGKQEGKIEAARRMLEEGLAEELIIKITGLSREEIQTLRKE